MSTNGSTNNVTAIETDMRDVLRERKARLSNVSRETDNNKAEIIRSGTCLLLTTLPCAAAVQATTMRQRFSTSLRSGTRVPLLCHLT